jgi:hypothetical protein
MCARWETGETVVRVRGPGDVAVVAAFACAAVEIETDPTAMAATAPAATILLVRIRCSLARNPPVHPSEQRVRAGWTPSPPSPETMYDYSRTE